MLCVGETRRNLAGPRTATNRQLATFSLHVDHLLVFANERLAYPELVAEKIGSDLTIFDDQRLPRVTQALRG